MGTKEFRAPQFGSRRSPVLYVAAVVATISAALVRLALTPLIGDSEIRFTIFLPAVLVSAWFGGFRVGVLSILLSALVTDYYFLPPVHSLLIHNPNDQIALIIFMGVGCGLALLSRSQRRALERADAEASFRKNAENAERAQRQRFETTLASIGDGVIATDAWGRVSFMNAVAESLTGWNLKDALGHDVKAVFRIVNEVTKKQVENPALRAMQAGRVVGLANHTVLIARDGTETPIDDSGSPIKNSEGNPLGAVLIFRNIAERRKVEKERELLAEQALMLDSGFDAIIVRDPQDRITSWNRVAEKLYGWTSREAAGQVTHSLLKTVFPKAFEEIIADLHRNSRWEGELIHHRKVGNPITVLSHWILARDAQGQPLSILEINIDITERKLAAELERQSRRAAEEANRAKDEFLAMLSHELRNPLSAIQGWVVILRKGEMPVERVSHALEVIERNARLEAQLVESLLDLSRIAAGKFRLDSGRVDLSVVLKTVVDSQRPAAEAKGITLNFAASSGAAVLVGDSGRLQQIFSNLLTNSVKFTAQGGHIQVRLTRTGSHLQVQVVDDGEGIQADFIPHIFDRFRQAESAMGRTHGGLGLGLAIVRELVHAHGGTIVAESPGKQQGSTFTVTLPIPAVIPTHFETAALPMTVEDVSISGLRVLVVDDDADARELISLTLNSRGAVVQLASSAAEALECIQRQKPDVMIADIGMPQEDGYAMMRKLRTFERDQVRKRLPAIALTAYAGPADRGEALAAGYNIYLTKPVAPADLANAIRGLRATHGLGA